jgi:hypothetical protein
VSPGGARAIVLAKRERVISQIAEKAPLVDVQKNSDFDGATAADR